MLRSHIPGPPNSTPAARLASGLIVQAMPSGKMHINNGPMPACVLLQRNESHDKSSLLFLTPDEARALAQALCAAADEAVTPH